jgi:hypothetical protein
VFKSGKFDIKTELLNSLPVLVSAALYVWFYYAVYGIIAPFGVKELHENIYSADPSMRQNQFEASPAHFLSSTLAVIFDRDYGLLPYCLLYVVSLWGIALVTVRKNLYLLAPLLLCVPYLTLFLLWKDWTGSMTPARQLMPAVPALIFYGAYFLQHSLLVRTRIFKGLAFLSFFVSWLLMSIPPLRYAASKDKIYGFISAHAPKWALWFFPAFRDNIPAAIIESIICIIIISILFYFYAPKDEKTA